MINFTEEELLRQRLANAESIISDYVEFVNELCYALPDMQDDDAAAEALIVAEVEGIVEENAELKAERRKFTECTSSNGCLLYDGGLGSYGASTVQYAPSTQRSRLLVRQSSPVEFHQCLRVS